MRILITGGAGFVGWHLVDACLAQGHEVAVNVGTGRDTSVRAGDLMRSLLDATRARRILGWEPTVTPGQGLQRTWAWFVANTAEPARAAA